MTPRPIEARVAVKELELGDVIRIPQYKNVLEVTHLGKINGEPNATVGIEFVERPTRATKTLITNRHSGLVYLIAGTQDKGEVDTIEVVR